MTYAILRTAGHNQVYYKTAGQLAQVEVALCLTSLLHDPVVLEDIGGLSYVTFSTEQPLIQEELQIISRLSPTFGLFLKEGELLRPITLPNTQVLDRSVATILKYQGKTNELFTRMLLNIAYTNCNVSPENTKILDPVAGKGTTLFEALSLGSQVYGVEVQEKSVQEGQNHLKKFLEHGKIKHKTGSLRVSGPNKSFTAKRHTIDFENQHFEMICGDSKYCDQYFSSDFFHIVVGDLPYGVQHGNQAGGKHRSPSGLLHGCVKGWHKVLKKQGVLVLSWNVHVLSREQMEGILEKYGFIVMKEPPFDGLEHTVDASILRDVVVAKKLK